MDGVVELTRETEAAKSPCAARLSYGHPQWTLSQTNDSLGKRQHLKRLRQIGLSSSALSVGDDLAAPAVASSSSKTFGPGVDCHFLLQLLHCHDIRQEVCKAMLKASLNWRLGQPNVADLPALTRINAFDALARNAFILQIPVELLESEDGPSPFLLEGPLAFAAVPTSPPDLAPTKLQREVQHHPWLDLLPVPALRDNILAGIRDGRFDEDELAQQLVCDLLKTDAIQNAHLMIWGNSWEIDGWEFSSEFLERWASILVDCPQVLRATNRWRGLRGSPPLDFDEA